MRITMQNHCEPSHSQAFNALVKATFGFDFTEWMALGQWKDNYESYSMLEDGRMLANVCVYKAPLLIRGRVVDAVQLGAVATAQDCRGKGYQRALIGHVLEKYAGVPAFLHANASVIHFYPRFGFRRVTEWLPSVSASIENSIDPVRLAPGDARVWRALERRGARSGVIDSLGYESVQVFHWVMAYGNSAYYLPGLDVVVMAGQHDDVLLLHDVVAGRPVPFEELTRHLPFAGIRRVEFGFTPDWLGVDPVWTPILDDDEALFIRGAWDLPERFRMPATSLT